MEILTKEDVPKKKYGNRKHNVKRAVSEPSKRCVPLIVTGNFKDGSLFKVKGCEGCKSHKRCKTARKLGV